MTRRKWASCSANPTGHRSRERRWHGGPGHDAHEQRQGAAITRQPARGLRQSTTQLAQQQTHQAPPVQNSPSTSCTAPLSVQNSPCSPEMAQFGAYSACRESFVPFSPPRSQAGRILYRTRGRVGASHDSTTRPVRKAPRNHRTRPRRGLRPVGRASTGSQGHRQTNFAHNFPRSFFETARKRCNSNDTNSMFEQAAEELRAKLLWRGLRRSLATAPATDRGTQE